MEITFDKLTYWDSVYIIDNNGIGYKKELCGEIKKDTIKITYEIDVKREKVTSTKVNGSYGKVFLIFCEESDAIRYCKSQSVKHINRLIESAKKAINEIRDFKEMNFENLNHKWTEGEISKLENSIKRH